MKRFDVAVVGAGPAGLAAAIEAQKRGLNVLLVDMNLKAGGQLIKQIHKFFGSHEHRAGTRGIDIARDLYEEAVSSGVEVWLDAAVYAIYPGPVLEIARGILATRTASKEMVHASRVVLATGASENAVSFPGWTLPGVMGAGAAQTMINVERVLPGKRVLMVGSGNVGLIVTYQLLQAGAEVVAIVEVAPKIGGYGVHSAKVRRAGVPILTSYTVLRAFGDRQVEGAEIVAYDEHHNPIEETRQFLDVDTICIAAGLKPYAKLAALAGCELIYSPVLGGWMPVHDENMHTSVPGIYVAGDLAGVEEASTALEEGRLAGLSAAESLGKGGPDAADEKESIRERLSMLRIGPFGKARADAKSEVIKVGEKICRAG
ncbi:MAG TPA: FAD-dependent oxidoreductase [Clostridia bacterium]|nr:FAD-dependent oxidoreductase [Clostridia bacterium]